MLSFYGAIVTIVSTALDALAAAPDADIIVTDFALPPGEDGVWLLGASEPATSPYSRRPRQRVP
jgi:CheY-like chemotaxis protein